MTYFLLPSSFSKTYESIQYSILDPSISPIFISATLSNYLSTLKEKITTRERTWDIYKKYTNPYEYIHTPVPMKKKSVSKIRPISRSYFKMIEMIHLFELIPDILSKNIDNIIINDTDNYKNKNKNIFVNQVSLNMPPSGAEMNGSAQLLSQSTIRKCVKTDYEPIRTFHLAEGPGGFIEAIATLRNNPKDIYFGMTLIDTTPNSSVPLWKKSADFLGRFPNVSLEYGEDGTGNILVLENLRYCKERYGSSMDIITGDGGFDFSVDFNHQEIAIGKLLFGQLVFAVTMQRKGGSFVLKIFDSFMKHTLDILYLLASFYETVHIFKPKTSRYANSEKYIICKGFLFDSNEDFYPFIERGFIQMIESPDDMPCRFIDKNINLPFYFIQKIEEFNSIFGQKQIQNIFYTLLLIDNKSKQEKIDNLIKTNIQKSIHWCINYGVDYHILIQNSNIFSDFS